jgi:NAD(P)-dependent dehydrogenase (short-subunit alcohol dehydrogenase family)
MLAAEEEWPMAGKIAGQVVIVTGASSGIGAVTARELAARGARVVLAARREKELREVAGSCAGEAHLIVPTDILQPDEIRRLVEKTLETCGRIDVVVNNAGIGGGGRFDQVTEEQIRRNLEVNLYAPMLLSRLVLPGMLARGHGIIISVASVAGHIGTEPIYSATKFGLRGFSIALARKLRGTGVTASVVSPGFVRTPMNSGRTGRLPGPDIVAGAIAGLIERPRREVVVPGYYRGAIWAEALIPGLLDRLISGR